MSWSNRFQSDPRVAQAVTFASGRPGWVLKATGFVAAVVFLVPLVLLALVFIVAALVTMLAYTLFSAIAGITGLFAGPAHPGQDAPANDGRENVRVIHRP